MLKTILVQNKVYLFISIQHIYILHIYILNYDLFIYSILFENLRASGHLLIFIKLNRIKKSDKVYLFYINTAYIFLKIYFLNCVFLKFNNNKKTRRGLLGNHTK